MKHVHNPGLTPLSDIHMKDGRTHSSGPLPWMKVEIPAARWAGRWVRLVFEASLLDPLTRPVLRFVREEDYEDCVLPAPVFGRGMWIGLIPPGTIELRVSPADWIGPFSFRIARLAPISLPSRFAKGLQRHPKSTLTAVWAGLQGKGRIERKKMRLALGATPLAMYRQWRAAGARPIEWGQLDALAILPEAGPRIHLLVIDAAPEERTAWQRYVAVQSWKKVILSFVKGDEALKSVLQKIAPSDLVTALGTRERLEPYALAAVAQRAVHEPAALYYADEETPEGPRLKPDWSPVLAQHVELIGRAWFARADWLRKALPEDATARALLAALPSCSIEHAVHIRRPLLSRTLPSVQAETARPSLIPPSLLPGRAGDKPLATIIIPTRDRFDLLSCCVRSLREKTKDDVFEVILIDNGTVDDDAKHLLAELALDPRFTILPSPGPFNFSALCNKAARLARGETLVFLNNDIEVLSGDWLAFLLHWTGQQDIGAVGTKLIYDNNTIQHGGVILGIDGRAAHFERNLPLSAAGFFGRLSVPHELSAVTAACFAVSAEKFHAIGGFDERNLPVDLSDVDLCLRLAERGWRTLLDPRAVLLHHESASRGKKKAPELVYRQEIAYFRRKWLHALRNDPYYHPALTLDWFRPALG